MAHIYNAMPDEAAPAEVETEKLGPVSEAPQAVMHYALGREVGRGGMSVVYEATDTWTEQKVALKLLSLPPSLSEEKTKELVARFEREARTMARLSHPNVIRILEIGVLDDRHFIAMEYLHGQTLRERMKVGAMTLREAYPILAQIAGALDAVHDTGIVHRDVKPMNVMLLPDGTVRLLDFGIAQSHDETIITHSGILAGSPSYMAPEQVKDEAGTPASDLWALGVLTYEMLTGHLPFAGKTIGSVLYQIVHQSPAPTPDLPVAIQRVLRRALDKRPSQRYPTADAFVQALKPSTTEQDLLNGPAPAPERVPPVSRPSFARPVSARPVSAGRWATGLGVPLLFLLGFGGAMLMRHHDPNAMQASSQGQTEAVASSPAPLSLPPAAVPEAESAVPPVLAAPKPAPVTLREVSAAREDRRPAASPREAPAAPEVVSKPLPRRLVTASPVIASPVIASPVSVPSTTHKAAVRPVPIFAAARPVHLAAKPAPAQTAQRPVQVAAQRVPAERVPVQHVPAERAPVQRIAAYQAEIQRAPVQAAPPSIPASVAAQSVTLPSDDTAAGPEAAARRRKSVWSQGDAPGSPQ